MHRTYVLLTSLCLALSPALSQQAAKKATPRAAAKKSTEPRFKAIWEPVNVKDDLKLFSVHFVSPDEGWVAGGRDEVNGGVILHTKDGGATWETQLGDSQSSDRAYRQMRFLGPTLGWVTQSTSGGDHNLLRTNDGMNWSPAGTVAQHRTDYWFTSEQVGFVTSGPNIERTQDGGRHWQPAYRCQVNTEVNGLTRRLSCEFESIFFVDSNVGYALSHAIAQGAGFVLAKTTDGGATWQTSVVLPGEDAKESSLWFSDENHGVMRTINGKVFYTDDGGKSWSQAAVKVEGKPQIQFAGAELGWMIAYNTMAYTADGGKHWVSREIAFPASVNAFSLVSHDRGYAVGDHGMVYKYRIVPIEYTAKGMLAAPAMPAK